MVSNELDGCDLCEEDDVENDEDDESDYGSECSLIKKF